MVQEMIDTGVPTWSSMYHYDEWDRKVYWLTRQIKGLSIDSCAYERFFHSSLEDDFAPILTLFHKRGLLSTGDSLTVKGRYFADAISGLLVDYIFTLKEEKSEMDVHLERAHYLMQRFDQRRGNDARMHFMG